MTRIVHCPQCQVELTIPTEAGSKRLRCPKCATRFYPDGRPASAGPSSVSIPTPKAKAGAAPPPKRAPEPAAPALGDLRDLLDAPFADEPRAKGKPMADVAALFADEPAAPRRRPAAEARRNARRCTSCSAVVPAGMSLCENCGLDQDTGERYEVEEPIDEAPVPMSVPGPPASVLVIGLVVLVIGLCLAVLSLFQLEGLGRLCLTLVCLFGAFAGFQFLRGKAPKLMIVALLLAAGVDLVVLIVLPVVLGEETVVTAPGDGDAPDGSTTAVQIVEKPVTERIDMTKLTLGVAIFVIDAVLLLAASSPGVRRYFERRHHAHDQGFVIP